MKRRLIVATHNANKTEEIRAILGRGWSVTDLSGSKDSAPDESGATFAENAAIKALAASASFPDACILADDSGLEVDALGGSPGIYSARYAGDGATDDSNRGRLASELERAVGKTWQAPQAARFRCAIALAQESKIVARFDGTVEGCVRHPAQGSRGFGYDSVFVPNGYDKAFGELDLSIKNKISHRARALAQAKAWLEQNTMT